MKNTLLLLLFSIQYFLIGQTTNQFDAEGKKHGIWKLFLDHKGAKLNDSIGAVYFRYTYYDHGVHVYPMGNFIGKGGRIEENGLAKSTTGIKMLDGEYKCFDKKGKLNYIHTFKDGVYVSYKEYYPNGKLHTFFDYTKHYKDQPYSWYLIEYKKNGDVKYEDFVRKDDTGKWPNMRG